jgi:glycosyltransferase involved in cell wall biosynthesis
MFKSTLKSTGNLKISVVVCCYSMKRLNQAIQTVDSLLAQIYKPCDVIVAVDHTVEVFETLKTQLHRSVKVVINDGSIRGLSETRNLGIRMATGDIIAFIDDDAEAEPDWLKTVATVFLDPRVVAVAGEAIAAWPKGKAPYWFPPEFDFIVGCTEHKRLILQNNREVRNVTGSNMAFRRVVFDKVGYWETRLGRRDTSIFKFNPSGGEEAELCLRIKKTIPDGLIVFEPNAIVHHKVSPERATLKYVFGYCYREGITRVMMQRIVSGYNDKALAAENRYVKGLLFHSVPSKAKTFYKVESLGQIGVIVTNLFLVGIGFIIGKWRDGRGWLR